MNTATRLGLYGAGLAVVFGGAFVAADAVVPESTVRDWTAEAKGHDMGTDNTSHGTQAMQGGHGDHATAASSGGEATVRGVTSADGGYLLTPVTAPGNVGDTGTLSFQVLDAQGDVETSFAVEHDKELHLIVVRTDGTQFRHVHPTMAADGTWSLPWSWPAAGTYRVYADFVLEGTDADGITLTRTVEVGGQYAPATVTPTKTATVDGFRVDLTGDLVAGSSSDLVVTVFRDGKPVTALQPYLGAFGHLVALREGDLAYLHVHPEGAQPAPDELSGPDVQFAAEAPTPGRYLLYLDFRVDGEVHSAPFVVDTTAKTAAGRDAAHESNPEPDSGSGDGHDH